MIRQAISCDICGAEKRQTNHWFVAYEQAGELRVSGWNSRNRLRTNSKHLCGQACLHKLADEFMERTIARRIHAPQEEIEPEMQQPTDTSLTSGSDFPEMESSARLIPTPQSPTAKPVPRPAAALVAMPERVTPERMAPELVRAESPAPATEEPQRYASRNWRAEAWERERERNLHTTDHRSAMAPRRISQA